MRRAFLLGLVFGAAFYFTHIVWMRRSASPPGSRCPLLETLFYGVLGLLSAVLQRHRLWPLWFAAAWTTVEVVRSGWPLGGMPWGRLAFAVADTPVAPRSPYVGAVGVSFLLALLGALLAAVVLAVRGTRAAAAAGARARRRCCALLAVPVVLPWDAAADGRPRRSTWPWCRATCRAGATTSSTTTGRSPRTTSMRRSTSPSGWPRGEADAARLRAVAGELHRDRPVRRRRHQRQILEASAAIGVPILVGAIVDGGPNEVLNQGIVWDPETGAGDRYTKRHPVPFGEYVPLRSVFLRYNFFDRLRDVGRDMLTGTRDEPLDIGGVPVADAICFDVAYDDGITAQVSRGAELLVVQTSNATFIRTDQIDQQFAITRLRAIETGRWTAVASTNGVTGVIAPDGEVVDVAEPRTQDVLRASRWPSSTRSRPATRIGALVGPGPGRC